MKPGRNKIVSFIEHCVQKNERFFSFLRSNLMGFERSKSTIFGFLKGSGSL
jgi:hypothetical protein